MLKLLFNIFFLLGMSSEAAFLVTLEELPIKKNFMVFFHYL